MKGTRQREASQPTINLTLQSCKNQNFMKFCATLLSLCIRFSFMTKKFDVRTNCMSALAAIASVRQWGVPKPPSGGSARSALLLRVMW